MASSGPFDGDLDDYQRWLLEQSRAVQRAAAKGEKYAASPKAEAPKAAAQAPAPAPAPAPAVQQGPARREDRKAQAQARAKVSERTRPLRAEIERIDSRMAVLAKERAACEARMASGSLPGSEMADLGRKLNHILAEVTKLEERWLELSTEIESLQAAAG